MELGVGEKRNMAGRIKGKGKGREKKERRTETNCKLLIIHENA
jgi:hypothetical protein